MTEFFQTREQIENWLKAHLIKDYELIAVKNKPYPYVINAQSVNLQSKKIEIIRVKFNDIQGDFDCAGNSLANLDFAPNKVSGYFYCQENKLTSLLGAPYEVKGDFNCAKNFLTNLDFAPSTVEGSFSCQENKLTSLRGSPYEIKGEFNCSHNQLISLEGGPQEVSGYYICSFNQLENLKGVPKEIKEGLYIYNNKLTSLEGAPQKIEGELDISVNPLTTIEGLWSTVFSSDAIMYFNKTNVLELKEFKKECTDRAEDSVLSVELMSLLEKIKITSALGSSSLIEKGVKEKNLINKI